MSREGIVRAGGRFASVCLLSASLLVSAARANAAETRMSLLERVADATAGELNHVAEAARGWWNFAVWLDATGNEDIGRPEQDMSAFDLGWLTSPLPLGKAVSPASPTETMGQFPGKAGLLTGSSRFLDRMGKFRGEDVDLSKFFVVGELSSRGELAIGRRLETEALFGYFRPPLRTYMSVTDGPLVVATVHLPAPGGGGGGAHDWLTTSGGTVEGALSGGTWTASPGSTVLIGDGGETIPASAYPHTVNELFVRLAWIDSMQPLPAHIESVRADILDEYALHGPTSPLKVRAGLQQAYDGHRKPGGSYYDARIEELDAWARSWLDGNAFVLDKLADWFDDAHAGGTMSYDDGEGTVSSMRDMLGEARKNLIDNMYMWSWSIPADKLVLTDNAVEVSNLGGLFAFGFDASNPLNSLEITGNSVAPWKNQIVPGLGLLVTVKGWIIAADLSHSESLGFSKSDGRIIFSSPVRAKSNLLYVSRMVSPSVFLVSESAVSRNNFPWESIWEAAKAPSFDVGGSFVADNILSSGEFRFSVHDALTLRNSHGEAVFSADAGGLNVDVGAELDISVEYPYNTPRLKINGREVVSRNMVVPVEVSGVRPIPLMTVGLDASDEELVATAALFGGPEPDSWSLWNGLPSMEGGAFKDKFKALAVYDWGVTVTSPNDIASALIHPSRRPALDAAINAAVRDARLSSENIVGMIGRYVVREAGTVSGEELDSGDYVKTSAVDSFIFKAAADEWSDLYRMREFYDDHVVFMSSAKYVDLDYMYIHAIPGGRGFPVGGTHSKRAFVSLIDFCPWKSISTLVSNDAGHKRPLFASTPFREGLKLGDDTYVEGGAVKTGRFDLVGRAPLVEQGESYSITYPARVPFGASEDKMFHTVVADEGGAEFTHAVIHPGRDVHLNAHHLKSDLVSYVDEDTFNAAVLRRLVVEWGEKTKVYNTAAKIYFLPEIVYVRTKIEK